MRKFLNYSIGPTQRSTHNLISVAAFLLFIVSVGIHKCQHLLQNLIGKNPQDYFPISILFLPMLFLATSYILSPAREISITRFKSYRYVLLIFLSVHMLLVYGLIDGNNPEVILEEYYTAWIIYFAYKLSADKQIWALFEGSIKWIFYIFAFLVFSGITYPQQRYVETEQVIKYENITTATLAYEISPILDLWPFLFLLGFIGKKRRWAALLPLIIYLAFQLFFLKRAPMGRTLIFFIVAVSAAAYLRGNIVNILKLLIIGSIFIGVLLYIMPQDLIERFKTKDTARLSEAIEMFNQFSPSEHIFGRGLGGHYTQEEGGGLITINEMGQEGKYSVHIGAIYPYLKGGVLFFILVAGHIIFTMINGFIRINELNHYQLASLIFLFVYGSFRLIEGPISPGTIFDGLLFGMSLGCLNFRARQPMN